MHMQPWSYKALLAGAVAPSRRKPLAVIASGRALCYLCSAACQGIMFSIWCVPHMSWLYVSLVNLC